MAWPTPRRLVLIVSLLSWFGIQTFFFIPRGWPYQAFIFILESKQGDFHIFQKGREAVLVGAFSDRYQRFPKMELVPLLKKKGIRRINKIILTGHDPSQTGALFELQKNFDVGNVFYPLDSAARMRKTFDQINQNTQLMRLVPGILEKSLFWKIECLSVDEKGSPIKIEESVGS